MRKYLTSFLSGNIKTSSSLPSFQKQIQETNRFLDSVITGDGLIRETLTKIRPCPFCGDHSDNEMMIWKGFHWKTCSKCQMAYVCNPLSQNFHEMDIYSCAIDHLDVLENTVQEHNPVTEQAIETLEYAGKIFPNFGGVCDIGCGNGGFLHILKKKGIPVFGIDINPKAVSITKSKGIPASLIQDFSEKDISHLKPPVLFTMRQLIEHVEDIKKLLDGITSLTSPPWMLLIETPNLNSYNAGKLGFRHRHFYGWVHLQILSSKTMQRIADDFQMNLLDVSTYGPAQRYQRLACNQIFSSDL